MAKNKKGRRNNKQARNGGPKAPAAKASDSSSHHRKDDAAVNHDSGDINKDQQQQQNSDHHNLNQEALRDSEATLDSDHQALHEQPQQHEMADIDSGRDSPENANNVTKGLAATQRRPASDDSELTDVSDIRVTPEPEAVVHDKLVEESDQQQQQQSTVSQDLKEIEQQQQQQPIGSHKATAASVVVSSASTVPASETSTAVKEDLSKHAARSAVPTADAERNETAANDGLEPTQNKSAKVVTASPAASPTTVVAAAAPTPPAPTPPAPTPAAASPAPATKAPANAASAGDAANAPGKRVTSPKRRKVQHNSPSLSVRKHPLEFEWSFWVSDPRVPWERALTHVHDFGNIEDFWALFNNLKAPSEARYGYCLFRKGVRPEWEDESNQMGGRWILSYGSDSCTDQLWRELALMSIGGATLDHLASNVNGVYVARKTKNNSGGNCSNFGMQVSVWLNSTDRDTVMPIGEAIRNTLATYVHRQFTMEYIYTKSQRKKSPSYRIPDPTASY